MTTTVRRRLRTAVVACVAVASAQTALPAVAAAPAERAAADDAPVVQLDSGSVRGLDTGPTKTFSGIRYAQPPVGSLRWKDPQPVHPWDGVADAMQPGNPCPQEPVEPDGEPATDEDCLFLNVTVPDGPARGSHDDRPVMVWLHGGGYTSGTGAAYDAQRLATQGDVIVVTINYRLGVFGYFGHPELEGSGTFGLADQIAALQWTQRNAAAFGGDPQNVTVFGESAGAMSACALLTSPAAKGLFDKAILSSGSCLLDWPKGTIFPSAPALRPYTSLRQSEAHGGDLAARADCDDVDCMREKSAAELVGYTGEFGTGLAYGTPLLPDDPAAALRRGDFHRVPVMSGGTRDEMRAFIAGAIETSGPIMPERYTELVNSSFGDQADDVAAHYPLSEYDSPALAWATLTTDVGWSCPTLTADRLLAEHTPTYAFEFADRDAPTIGPELPELPQGAAHATELPYLFDLGGENLLTTPEQQRLARQMVAYWTAFAHNGDPNTPLAPRWPEFRGQNPVLSLVPDAVRPTDYATDHQCRFWDQVAR